MADDTEALKAEIQDLKDQVDALKKLLGDTGTSFNKVKLSTDALLGPFGSLVDATKSGATGLSVYNQSLDKGGDTVKMFTGLMGEMGKGLDLAGGALTKYVQMVNVQADELYKSYQGLASVGAAGKADLKSIMDTAKQFGAVSEKDLPRFTQMIAQNSETLAKFGGTAAEGLKTFGAVSAEIQQSGLQTQFMNMGMTVDSINKGMAGYLKMQTQTGAAQKMTTDQLAAGAADYIKNLDTLSKLTGKSGEAIQKERDERLLNEQYSIHQRQLQQKADAGDEEAKRKLAEEDKVLSQTSGDARKGFLAAFSGLGMQTEEGRKLFMSAPEAFKMAASGTGVEAGKILDSAKTEFGKTMDQFGGVIMAAGNKLFVNVSDMRATENLKGTAEEREKEAKRQQQEQIERTAASVAAQTALTQEQRKATENLTNFVTLGIDPVQVAMVQLARSVTAVTDLLPGAKGTAPVGATAAEKQRFDELLEKQKREQGAGPAIEGGAGSRVGQPPTAEKPTMPGGMTLADMQKTAAQKSGELADAIAASKEALGKKIDGVTDAAREGVKKWIESLTSTTTNPVVSPTPTPTPNPSPNPSPNPNPTPSVLPPRNSANLPMSQVAALAPLLQTQRNAVPKPENMITNIGQGNVNINSANTIKFPEMNTRYKPTMDKDVSRELRTEAQMSPDEFMKMSGMKKIVDSNTAGNTNNDVVASNALVAAKMDELISLMRTSNGYQQKISMQTYA